MKDEYFVNDSPGTSLFGIKLKYELKLTILGQLVSGISDFLSTL